MECARTFARDIASGQQPSDACVVLLRGDLGAGKTTFVKGFLSYFGITPHQASPTFVLMRRFMSTEDGGPDMWVKQLYHIDAYRLFSFEDLNALQGGNVLSDSSGVVLLEWPERLGVEKFPGAYLVTFSHGASEQERTISISKVS
jgi:tRNA threonylcarbamoyladenosine biosynthesis protein TsaE